MTPLISSPAIPWQTVILTNRIKNADHILEQPNKDKFPGKKEKQLKKASLELESLFIYYLLKQMRATVPKSGFIPKGKVEEIYTSLIDFRLAEQLALERSIGISRLIYESLQRISKPEKSVFSLKF